MAFNNMSRDQFPLAKKPWDPIKQSARTGRQHRNAATGYTLFNQSAMPFGEHSGKIMERVPAEYLLWLIEQPWSGDFKWRNVKVYIALNLEEIKERAAKETPREEIVKITMPDGMTPLSEAPWIYQSKVRFSGRHHAYTLQCTCGEQHPANQDNVDATEAWKLKHYQKCS